MAVDGTRAAGSGGGKSCNPCAHVSLLVRPSSIAPEGAGGRPIGHGQWDRVLIELFEITSGVDHLSSNKREVRSHVGKLTVWATEVIFAWYGKVRKLTDLYLSLLALLVGEPCDVFGPHAQRSLSIQTVSLCIQVRTTDGHPCRQP